MCDVLQSINRSAEECGSGEIYRSRTLQTQLRTSAEVGVTVGPPQLDIPFRGYLLRVGRPTHVTELRKLVPMPLFASGGQTADGLLCSLSQKIWSGLHGVASSGNFFECGKRLQSFLLVTARHGFSRPPKVGLGGHIKWLLTEQSQWAGTTSTENGVKNCESSSQKKPAIQTTPHQNSKRGWSDCFLKNEIEAGQQAPSYPRVVRGVAHG